MTPLQQRMIEAMTVRGLVPSTQRAYLRAVRDLAAYVAQNERGCHQRQCSCSTHLFRHLREAMNHPKGLCQNLS